ncbi:MAG: hypothetical protein LCH36_07135 [Actinobacteria bacterium]|nr:hypothetical protein [Actinomycetota bacterium]
MPSAHVVIAFFALPYLVASIWWAIKSYSDFRARRSPARWADLVGNGSMTAMVAMMLAM